VSHSANGDPFAAEVRDALVEELERRGHRPLVDRALVQPGDRWRACLLNWLGACQGAVVLLTKRAVDREWVRAEATILGWRSWLDPSLRVVPALLDGDTPEIALDGLGLGPVQFREIQGAVLDVPGGDARDWARTIAARFEGYRAGPADDPVAKWCRQVSRDILGNDFLADAAATLDVPAADRVDAGGSLAVAVADRLLCSTADRIELGVLDLYQDGRLDVRHLAALVSNAWLPEGMAGPLFAVAQLEQGPRVVTVRVVQPSTAVRLLRRLTCCDNRYVTVPALSAVGAGADDGATLLARYRTTILARVGAETPGAYRYAIASLHRNRHKPVFVLLGEDAMQLGVLPPLLAEFSELTFVCAGTEASIDGVLGQLGEHGYDPQRHVVELTPRLEEGFEMDGATAARRIEGLGEDR